ncbi:cyanophycinase [Roseateles sp. YR242]|uniref:cyanophycinase n=1 Tax=Roseateles sp. YR242 TaxID=1855305 RepID=UPI0015A6D632|nr:cyanophycinase [Roseateles sp. YR242]
MSDRAAGDGHGLLALIGGNEDRDAERAVLGALVRALPVPQPRVLVFTAASGGPELLWAQYQPAFEALGARPAWLDARSTVELDQPGALALLEDIDLLFMTGGDQHRLMDTLGGSQAWERLAQRHAQEGLALAGTSAGASALGARMPRGDEGDQIAGGPPGPLPPGLGAWPLTVVDQHFAQRRRLARLVQFLGVSPGHIGLGLDEDTALLLHPAGGLEVVGSGAVTVVVGGGPGTRLQAAGPGECWSLDGVSLHLLTAGARLDNTEQPDGMPEALRSLLRR